MLAYLALLLLGCCAPGGARPIDAVSVIQRDEPTGEPDFLTTIYHTSYSYGFRLVPLWSMLNGLFHGPSTSWTTIRVTAETTLPAATGEPRERPAAWSSEPLLSTGAVYVTSTPAPAITAGPAPAPTKLFPDESPSGAPSGAPGDPVPDYETTVLYTSYSTMRRLAPIWELFGGRHTHTTTLVVTTDIYS
jgi:hypothetical protein